MNRNTHTRFRLTLIAGAALAGLSLAAQAAPTSADLQQVKAYGNVSVAQDTAGSWGPWEEFEAPAAGPTQPVGLDRAAGDPYRPLPTATGGNGGGDGGTPPTPPVILTLVGWGHFFEGSTGDCTTLTCHDMQISGSAQASTTGGLPTPGDLTLASLDNTAVIVGGTGTLALQPSGTSYLVDNGSQRVSIVADPGVGAQPNVQESQAAFVRIDLTRYLAGGGTTTQSSYAVVGVATSAAELNEMRAAGAIARYNGRDRYGEGNVTIAVNFGNGNWNGRWNEAADGAGVKVSTDAAGRQTITGPVGFWAGGRVNGGVLQSELITARDGTIDQAASKINASVMGPQGSTIGGIATVVKTKDGAYNGATYNSTFITDKVK